MINNKMLSWIFVAALFFSACSDDSEDNTNASYDGESFTLDKGFTASSGPKFTAGTHGIYIYLVSNLVSYDATEDDFTGSGNVIKLDVFTAEENVLTAGTYSRTKDQPSEDEFRLFGLDAKVFINYDEALQMDDEERGERIIFGTVIVSKDGDNFTFDLDITTETSTFIGTYTGSLLSI
ncbi:MAG: hypothetical protein ABJF11_03750 [Reichenbachiella sp.]|uniref:hypothetical protein n=1 Tax=Reichenbachiella sp. TaxID=2184521 RepID=UPI003263D169